MTSACPPSFDEITLSWGPRRQTRADADRYAQDPVDAAGLFRGRRGEGAGIEDPVAVDLAEVLEVEFLDEPSAEFRLGHLRELFSERGESAFRLVRVQAARLSGPEVLLTCGGRAAAA